MILAIRQHQLSAPTVSGTTHVANGAYTTAGSDQATALANLNGQSCTSLGAGAVALNAMDVEAGPSGALNPAANSKIVTAGCVCESDVFWPPTGAKTLEANTTLLGTIVDNASTTLGNNANLLGRALAFSGTVTTDTNAITVPTCTGYAGSDPGPASMNPPVIAQGIPTLSEWPVIMLAALLAVAG